MIQTWSEVLTASFQELWIGVIAYLPRILVAVIVFIAGWVIAVTLGKLVSQLIRALKVDKAMQAVGAEETLSKAGYKLDSGAFLGGLVRWFFLLVFLVASMDVLGLNQVNLFLGEVVLVYLPNVIVAALILLAASVLAQAVSRLVAGSVKAAGVHSHVFVGGIAKWAIWAFALLAALYQLGIAGVFAQTLFTGFVAMVAIGGGIAFGLGGKEAAGRLVEKLSKDVSER